MIPRTGAVVTRRGLIIEDLVGAPPLTFAVVTLTAPNEPSDRWYGLAGLVVAAFLTIFVWSHRLRRTHEIWYRREGWLVWSDVQPALWPIGGIVGCPFAILFRPEYGTVLPLIRAAICFAIALVIVFLARRERLKYGLVYHP